MRECQLTELPCDNRLGMCGVGQTYAEEIEWHRYEMTPDLGESLLDLLYRESPVRDVTDLEQGEPAGSSSSAFKFNLAIGYLSS